MKNKLLILSILFLSVSTHAQTYEDALRDAYENLEKSDSLSVKLNAVNRLDVIAARYAGEWTAHYYAAYGRVVISYLMEDEKKRDALIDQAETSLNKAKTLTKVNDEILVMEAYVANARLAVKPMSRYKKYGEIFDAKLAEATALNAANPRIYFLKGQSTFHTPRAFGGGCKNALPFFEKAMPLFAKEHRDDLNKPFWGRERSSYYINECEKQ